MKFNLFLVTIILAWTSAQTLQAAHSWEESVVNLPQPLKWRFNFVQNLSFEALGREYFETRPENRPVCGRPQTNDNRMIDPPGLVYRDGWYKEERWSIITSSYLGSTCFAEGRPVVCWKDIPYEQRPQNNDGFQHFSQLYCEVNFSTIPSINGACQYPVQANEAEISVSSYRHTIARHDRTRRRQVSFSVSQSGVGQEERLYVNIRCIRPVGDLRPLTPSDVSRALGIF